MAHRKRRRVSGNNTALWVLAAAAGAFALYEVMKPQQGPATIIKTATPVSSSSQTTAAEITAGASALTTIANDLFGNNDNS